MYDLIYADGKARTVLEKAFPRAKFEDASDFIHTERFSIELEIEESDYRMQVLKLGLALVSFNFQLWSMDKPKEPEKEKKWQEEYDGLMAELKKMKKA